MNGFEDVVTAYVFPTKFDLIFGRSWLKQTKPIPIWANDTWYLKNGYIELKPCVNQKQIDQSGLNYLISHKQANKSIKKGAESFLPYIKLMDENASERNPRLQDDKYWD
ncbi:hypothetical protein A0J61_11601 [Choanephora cucurbitarum]|uniref:Uncharacterized protein n=1 Tax=Choanephora cucurbitarum TaxID=101091 RepID=A0A1C7MU17_9FUNG|nr:hypothetical protein A0J61_11601 [Choanephora cucurbitarum]